MISRIISIVSTVENAPKSIFSITLHRLFILLLAFLAAGAAQAVDTVGYPNILYRNKLSGDGRNRVWQMNGTNYVGVVAINQLSDTNWKIVGTGNFDGIGGTDILWQLTTTGEAWVWSMNGTSFVNSFPLEPVGDPNWKIVAVADFNGDGWSDIVWQNLASVQNAVWLMVNKVAIKKQLINSNGDPNWRIQGAGRFDATGAPDLLLRNVTTGNNAIWFMGGIDGLEFLSGQSIKQYDPQGVLRARFENDLGPDRERGGADGEACRRSIFARNL